MEAQLRAFIVGYTGEVGKELVRAVLKSQRFSKVVLFGRREVQYEDELYKNAEQKLIDFDKLEEQQDKFQEFDVGFCCLGTTRSTKGAANFYKVDHDYVLNTAKVAKAGGCQQFHLVSSAGANKNSWFLYMKTKGQVEEDLKALDFNRLYIYRPGALACEREESRLVEKVIVKPITKLFPVLMSVPTSVVAAAMVNAALQPSGDKVTTIDNRTIHATGKIPFTADSTGAAGSSASAAVKESS